MTTEQLDELTHMASRVTGINSALDWVRDVYHLPYDEAYEEIKRRINELLNEATR